MPSEIFRIRLDYPNFFLLHFLVYFDWGLKRYRYKFPFSNLIAVRRWFYYFWPSVFSEFGFYFIKRLFIIDQNMFAWIAAQNVYVNVRSKLYRILNLRRSLNRLYDMRRSKVWEISFLFGGRFYIWYFKVFHVYFFEFWLSLGIKAFDLIHVDWELSSFEAVIILVLGCSIIVWHDLMNTVSRISERLIFGHSVCLQFVNLSYHAGRQWFLLSHRHPLG